MHPTGDLACNPGTCSDWESNCRPFSLQAGTQTTEPHQPGQWWAYVKHPKYICGKGWDEDWMWFCQCVWNCCFPLTLSLPSLPCCPLLDQRKLCSPKPTPTSASHGCILFWEAVRAPSDWVLQCIVGRAFIHPGNIRLHLVDLECEEYNYYCVSTGSLICQIQQYLTKYHVRWS